MSSRSFSVSDAVRASLWSLLALAVALVPASPALAHHPMGGRAPSTFAEGLLSGVAHPVIGPDHLLAIVAVAVLSLGFARGGALAALFVVSTIAGTGIHLLRVGIPAVEVLIAASVVVLGVLLVARRRVDGGALGAYAAMALGVGILHGYAYGESIVGAETSPLAAYLLGFTLVQLAIVALVRRSAGYVRGRLGSRALVASGGLVALAGAALVIAAL
jgi:urease accessory protein